MDTTKNILLLGGTGAMGSHLAELLAADKRNKVYVTTRAERAGKGGIAYIRGNAHDTDFILATLEARHYDAVFDFMVYGTAEFAARLDKVLGRCGQYIYLSSSRVYSGLDETITEATPRLLDTIRDEAYLATDEYALTKARQENLLRSSGHSNWTIVRPYITYSERRLQLGVMEKEEWLQRALAGRTIVFSRDIASHYTTLTYGRDVAMAMSRLAGREEALGQTYHITQPQAMRWDDVLGIYLDAIEKATGKRPKVKMIDRSPNRDSFGTKWQVEVDRLYDRRFDNSKIAALAPDIRFTKPEEGLARCIEAMAADRQFLYFNARREALYDRLTGERTRLADIGGTKAKLLYVAKRYFIR